MFNAIADAVDGVRPTRHLPYLPIYYGSIVAEKVVARVTRSRPMVTQLGAMMFGSDNKHSVEKARCELGYEPKVDLRTGITLAAKWFNAGQLPLI
jgi:nucleoside-diphosphate-sugar epimerase